MKNRATVSAVIAAIASPTLCAPIDLEIDPDLSSIDLTITVDVSVASASDSDSSPLSGYLRVELDDYANPTEISLHDLLVRIDRTLAFDWSFGFFGGASASLTGGAVTWGSTDNIVGPVPVADGGFELPDVPVALAGTMDVSYSILVVGSGSETVLLGDQGGFASTIAGSVGVAGGEVSIASTLPIDVTTPLTDDTGAQLGTLRVTGSATIVARGEPPVCAADLTGDGVLDFFDVSAFLSAYMAMDTRADFDGNGVFDFFDVSGFLGAFSAGCP